MARLAVKIFRVGVVEESPPPVHRRLVAGRTLPPEMVVRPGLLVARLAVSGFSDGVVEPNWFPGAGAVAGATQKRVVILGLLLQMAAAALLVAQAGMIAQGALLPGGPGLMAG